MEANEHWLGAARVNALKVLLWTLAGVITACGENRRVTFSHSVPEPAARQ